MRKISSFVVCFTLLSILFVGIDMEFELSLPARGAVIYVGGAGGGNLSTIQEGVDAANPGDTVFVFNGTYNEDVVVNKTITLTGEGRDITVVNGTGTGTVVEITADWTNITGFTVTNSIGDAGYAGIRLKEVDNCGIFHCNISSNGGDGIRLTDSSNNEITNNMVESNDFCGINFETYYVLTSNNDIKNNIVLGNAKGINIMSPLWEEPSYHVITDNTISDNSGDGIYLLTSTHNQILRNNITDNGGGILPLLCSDHNDISYNHMVGNDDGIWIDASGHNTVTNNNVSNNGGGITLTQGDWNDIFSNNIYSNSGEGISLWMSGFNDIKDNTIAYSKKGIVLSDSPFNYIYRNDIIKNKNQAQDNMDSNNWNNSYPSGGNYWSDYSGSDLFKGPNQDIPGSDGIGDDPYIIDADSRDYYPLMEPTGDFTFLKEGWNLISLPRIQQNPEFEKALSQINDSYNIVQMYNASENQNRWKHFNILKPPSMNDDLDIDHTKGLFIHITETGGTVFDFTGNEPSQIQTIPLYEGWNLVGYPSLSNRYRNSALNNLDFGIEIDAVWTYNSGVQRREEVGELNYFVVGKGYWIHATQDCVWEVPL